MTRHGMRKVVEDYIEALRGQGARPERQDDPRKDPLAHAWWMCERILEFLDGDQWEKANRWLGHIQGYFALTGLYTIDEMRDHNRTKEPKEGKTALLVFPVALESEVASDEFRQHLDAVVRSAVVADEDLEEDACRALQAHEEWLRDQSPVFGESYVAEVYKTPAPDTGLIVLIDGKQFRTEGEVRVIVPGVASEDEDGEEATCELHFNFTDEGVITDVLDGEGRVASTSSEMYEETLERLEY